MWSIESHLMVSVSAPPEPSSIIGTPAGHPLTLLPEYVAFDSPKGADA